MKSEKQTIQASLRVVLIVLLLLPAARTARAQFLDGSTGLMIAPSADMNPSGTFMITDVWLNKHYLPVDLPWQASYNSFAYSINITFWSRFEVAYICTLSNGSKLPNPPNSWYQVLKNQDRHFLAKFQLLKENEFGWKWVPSIAIGVSDPVTGAVSAEYIESMDQINGLNAYFNRFFVTISKHFDSGIGDIGLHAGYQYSLRFDWPYTGPCGGINWRPKWVQNDWVKLNLIAEYDSHVFNAGLVTSVYKDHFDLFAVWQNMQWFSFGARFKLVLF